jgi:hypothetical protein
MRGQPEGPVEPSGGASVGVSEEPPHAVRRAINASRMAARILPQGDTRGEEMWF